MSFLSKIFSNNSDWMSERAATVVEGAKIVAISSQMSCIEQFQLAANIDPKDWDFYVTVAGVFMAATRLHNLEIAADREDKLITSVHTKLSGWHPRGQEAFSDCKTFFERTYDELARSARYKDDRRFLASDSIGMWMSWNLLKHVPSSKEENGFTRTLGATVTAAFFDWWTK